MSRSQNLFYQILSIILASIFASLIFNQLRSKPLPLLKERVEIISELENLNIASLEPSITGINIKLARKLFEEKVLFVDARAEEYYREGHIPNAICNDDFDILAEQLEMAIGMDDPFVVYCSDDDCGSSEDLSYELQSYGFTNILLFKGGWEEWMGTGLPMEENE